MTYPQLEYYLHGGSPPKIGTRQFASSREARLWREANQGEGDEPE